MSIQVSDACPIQFYPASRTPYNKLEVVGMFKEPFHQKFLNSDKITIQMVSDELRPYEIKGYDSNDQIIYSNNFNYIGSVAGKYIYQITISAEIDNGVTGLENQSAFFGIVEASQSQTPVKLITGIICFHESLRGTKLIRYSDRNAFANTNFPQANFPIFELRIFCRFYDFRFPDEAEAEDVSNSNVVVLSSSTKSQRLLEVECCPAFMHKKIQLALQHNTVVIDNEYWVKEDSYSLTELDPRFPLKTGKVWLTERNGEFITNTFAEPIDIPLDGIFDSTFDETFD